MRHLKVERKRDITVHWISPAQQCKNWQEFCSRDFPREPVSGPDSIKTSWAEHCGSGSGGVGSVDELPHLPLMNNAKANLSVISEYYLGHCTYAESEK